MLTHSDALMVKNCLLCVSPRFLSGNYTERLLVNFFFLQLFSLEIRHSLNLEFYGPILHVKHKLRPGEHVKMTVDFLSVIVLADVCWCRHVA